MANPTTDEHVDRHDPADFAGWLRVRASENRRVAELPAEQWPKRPALLWHLALRFEQGAELVDEMRGEIEQLRRDLAIQTVNAKTVTDLQAEVQRLQAQLRESCLDARSDPEIGGCPLGFASTSWDTRDPYRPANTADVVPATDSTAGTRTREP